MGEANFYYFTCLNEEYKTILTIQIQRLH